MMGLKLTHVSKRGHWCATAGLIQYNSQIDILALNKHQYVSDHRFDFTVSLVHLIISVHYVLPCFIP